MDQDQQQQLSQLQLLRRWQLLWRQLPQMQRCSQPLLLIFTQLERRDITLRSKHKLRCFKKI